MDPAEKEEEFIANLTEEWRGNIARYLSLQPTTVSLADITSHVPKPQMLPTMIRLVDALQSDPLQRFAISGEGSTMRARRIFRVDDEEIKDFVAEWRRLLAEYLSTQSSTVGLSDIGSNVSRPSRLPTSVKLIDVLRSDPLNRFIITGDGNNIRAKFNFHLNEEQIETLVEQWRENISRFLSKQSTTVGLSDIGSHVARPFCLPNSIKLLETLQTDPLGRFAISGEGSSMRARRVFRVDDGEIVEFVEEWRCSIARYLASQFTTVSLSDIGSNVSRPHRLPTSVKLVEVMRADPADRFILSGDGNNIRAALSTFARAAMGLQMEPMMALSQPITSGLNSDGKYLQGSGVAPGLAPPPMHPYPSNADDSLNWVTFGAAGPNDHKFLDSGYRALPYSMPFSGSAGSHQQRTSLTSNSLSSEGQGTIPAPATSNQAHSSYAHQLGGSAVPNSSTPLYAPPAGGGGAGAGTGDDGELRANQDLRLPPAPGQNSNVRSNVGAHTYGGYGDVAGPGAGAATQGGLVYQGQGHGRGWAQGMAFVPQQVPQSQQHLGGAYGGNYGGMSSRGRDAYNVASGPSYSSRPQSVQDYGAQQGYVTGKPLSNYGQISNYSIAKNPVYSSHQGNPPRGFQYANGNEGFPVDRGQHRYPTTAVPGGGGAYRGDPRDPMRGAGGFGGGHSGGAMVAGPNSLQGRAGGGGGFYANDFAQEFHPYGGEALQNPHSAQTQYSRPHSSVYSLGGGPAVSGSRSSGEGPQAPLPPPPSRLYGDSSIGGGGHSQSLYDAHSGDSASALRDPVLGLGLGPSPGPPYTNANAAREVSSQTKQAAVPGELLCPLSRRLLDDPVICADGFTYSRRAIEDWLRVSDTSPQTGAQLSHMRLVPNTQLRTSIEDFKRTRLLPPNETNSWDGDGAVSSVASAGPQPLSGDVAVDDRKAAQGNDGAGAGSLSFDQWKPTNSKMAQQSVPALPSHRQGAAQGDVQSSSPILKPIPGSQAQNSLGGFDMNFGSAFGGGIRDLFQGGMGDTFTTSAPSPGDPDEGKWASGIFTSRIDAGNSQEDNDLPPGLGVGKIGRPRDIDGNNSGTRNTINEIDQKMNLVAISGGGTESSKQGGSAWEFGRMQATHLAGEGGIADADSVKPCTPPEGTRPPAGDRDVGAMEEPPEFIQLEDWLPPLFSDYNAELVETFVSKLRAEGFVTVRDLLEANSKAQLTFALLRETAGFRLGHYNRLVSGLSRFSGIQT